MSVMAGMYEQVLTSVAQTSWRGPALMAAQTLAASWARTPTSVAQQSVGVGVAVDESSVKQDM